MPLQKNRTICDYAFDRKYLENGILQGICDQIIIVANENSRKMCKETNLVAKDLQKICDEFA